MIDETEPEVPKKASTRHFAGVVIIIFFLFCAGSAFFLSYLLAAANTPPPQFPVDSVVVVRHGLSVEQIAESLKDAGAISSTAVFKLHTVLTGSAETLHAGQYRFPHPLSTAEIVDALNNGRYANESVVLTIPEGMRVDDIDTLVHEVLPSIELGAFTHIASSSEGYVFPDTYYFAPDAEASDVFLLLTNTFIERTASLASSTGERAFHDIVTMASILEREGNSDQNMRIIAGILWKRMELGMPLQVDATLEYERGKGSAELTLTDLETDSPYNTYTNRGLPPTPIANPGLIALTAAVHPTESPYLYYLTGLDGEFYYAKTFEEHKRNKANYLR